MAETSEAARAAFATLADVPATLAELVQVVRQQGAQLEALTERLPRDLATPAAFVRRFGISRSSVARGVRAGTLPVVEVGGHKFIDVGAIPRPVTTAEVADLARKARGR